MDTKVFMLLAAAMSKNLIIKLLEKEIQTYENAKDEESKDQAWGKLEMTCALVLAKAQADSPEEALMVAQDLNAMDAFLRNTPSKLSDDEAN